MTHNEIETTYTTLHRFLAGYFHEDWYDEVTRPEERLVGGPEPEPDVYRRAVRAFAAACSPEEGAKALRELEQVLEQQLADTDLATLLARGFGVRYWPGSDEAYRPWLQEVRATLKASVRSAA